ncbi:hypothetical protein Fmac_001834 [Flemingia macrophylla]|uniref:Uncharacterized protein n=1 Tax=Flemingia macrophylla TaxID=520843 RepID=A0ABD1NI80_9FABA
MGSKTLLVLCMFLAFVLVLSAEVAPKYVDDEEFYANDGVIDTNEMENGHFGVRHRGWRSGAKLPIRHCRHGCCRSFHGRCKRCCLYPGQTVEADADAESHN